MIRFETNVVKKYFAPLDCFVKIRVFTADEILQLIRSSSVTNRKSYLGLVINASMVNFNEEILPNLFDPMDEKLYELCVSVNPGMDINRITVPESAGDRSELHLLEQGQVDPLVNADRLKALEGDLRRRLIGQDQAISTVTRAIRKAAVGLRDPRRPISTLFFIGQTGVGKTELARALTELLFGGAPHLIRIDCSEYALPHEYAKLLGSPPGYVGYDEGGQLSARVAQAGQSFVLLFDEVEKSDVKIHDLMLQIMDDGQATDSKGRPINFKNAVLILTSNVGAEEIEHLNNRMGFRRDAPRPGELLDEIMSAVKLRFKPEFINRVNELVLFRPLGLDDCERIVSALLEQVKTNALAIPLKLVFTGAVPRFLAEAGYKPEWGARELRRTIEREVEAPLSDLVIEKKFSQGDRVVVRVSGDHLQFSKN